jgi:DNA repair exonuclease SbcCD ATPase subunit
MTENEKKKEAVGTIEEEFEGYSNVIKNTRKKEAEQKQANEWAIPKHYAECGFEEWALRDGQTVCGRKGNDSKECRRSNCPIKVVSPTNPLETNSPDKDQQPSESEIARLKAEVEALRFSISKFQEVEQELKKEATEDEELINGLDDDIDKMRERAQKAEAEVEKWKENYHATAQEHAEARNREDTLKAEVERLTEKQKDTCSLEAHKSAIDTLESYIDGLKAENERLKKELKGEK